MEAALDLIGDMRDDLNGTSAKITAAFFLEYAPVYLTGGDIGVFGQALIDEALVVAKVQIGLGAIVGNKNLTMLDRVHGTRINIDVRVEFLHGYFVAARFQQTPKGCSCDTFTEAGNNAAGNENILYRHGKTSFYDNCIMWGV